ncbi:MAG: hypothetical protein A4E53_01680 [Pelotomaculum sp. PtaB.Bin104]|nr:MAG: hypothetical protein A4E53_01680 [Pelotomaculum sp. PtaB.Bin104]
MKRMHKFRTAYGDFRTGDIGLSANNSWMGKAIRFFTSWHTSSASRNHAYLYQNKNIIVEALLKVAVSPASKYSDKDIVVYRIPLTEEERTRLELTIASSINGAYGYGKLALFAMDAITTKIKSLFGKTEPCFFFSSHFGVTNIPVCSQLVVWAIYKATDYRFKNENGCPVPWRIVTPDYLEDLLKLPINKAVKIYEQKIVNDDRS